jgi:hypothetical protein
MLPTPSRALLGFCALCCFALAFALAPSDVRSALVRSAPPGATLQTVPRLDANLAPVAPVDDAFAPRVDVDEDVPSGVASTDVRLGAARPAMKRAGVEPAPRVTAIAIGSHPTAIVETGSVVRTVTVGDELAGSRVSAIGEDAVELADGRRIVLVPDEPVQ